MSHDTATAVTEQNPSLGRHRTATVALWVAQVALAVTFLFAGGSKLAGAPAMVQLFDAVGFGQWFRYVTGTIEISAAIGLLIPRTAVFGALLLLPTMIGAVATNLRFGQSPVPPLVLLFIASIVAWIRRNQVRARFARGGRFP